VNTHRPQARLLVVEDNLVNQEFLRLSLLGWGEFVAVDSGEQALETVRSALFGGTFFDVIFMDIMLPGMDGLQTLERIRALENELDLPTEKRAKVIMTTSLDDNSKASRAFIHGQAVSYMTKPFRPGDVVEEMAKLGLTYNKPAPKP
jgi:two-component system chemotaxis response regulator CheY